MKDTETRDIRTFSMLSEFEPYKQEELDPREVERACVLRYLDAFFREKDAEYRSDHPDKNEQEIDP